LATLHSRKYVQPQASLTLALQSTQSEKVILLEKSRNKALIEHDSHELKAEAFQILSARYRASGLEIQADAYTDHAQMESATTRGFQAVIDAYNQKLEGCGIKKAGGEERPISNNLEAIEQNLERYNTSYSKCWEHTLQVLESDGMLQKLQSVLVDRSLTVAEKEQFKEAANQRDKFIRLAEKEALSAAESYKSFQSEIQSAEKAFDIHSRALKDNPLNPARSEQRRKSIATGMIVYQTLKVMDREL
jgi:hypothetical protein